MAKKQIGEVDYNVEFNDSVLSTQTWNNPRYNGSKTETQVLNKYTAGDTTYGTKTAVQKYTRNIYVGDYITACSGSDDPNLVPFPDFSYLMSTKYITVNEDDTVEEKRFRAGVPDEKRGFYRSFLEDFTPGTRCQVYLLNEGINNSLDDEYYIYFNEGRLKKILFFRNTEEDTDIKLTKVGGILIPNLGWRIIMQDLGNPAYLPGTASIFTNTETTFTYTGSYIGTDISGASAGNILGEIFRNIELKSIEGSRYFTTIITGSSTFEINPDVEYISNVGIKTSEIMSAVFPILGGSQGYVINSSKYDLRALGSLDTLSYFISKLNDNIPSILVNLPKYEHLPNELSPGNYVGGNFVADPNTLQGPKFVIIPENIHPYIKDNIKYFLTKAGLMAENQNLTLNTQNKQLL